MTGCHNLPSSHCGQTQATPRVPKILMPLGLHTSSPLFQICRLCPSAIPRSGLPAHHSSWRTLYASRVWRGHDILVIKAFEESPDVGSCCGQWTWSLARNDGPVRVLGMEAEVVSHGVRDLHAVVGDDGGPPTFAERPQKP